jgi:hypothetical protein
MDAQDWVFFDVDQRTAPRLRKALRVALALISSWIIHVTARFMIPRARALQRGLLVVNALRRSTYAAYSACCSAPRSAGKNLGLTGKKENDVIKAPHRHNSATAHEAL